MSLIPCENCREICCSSWSETGLNCRSKHNKYYPDGVMIGKKCGDCNKCEYLDDNNLCYIYNERPLECRIYPFMFADDNYLYLSVTCTEIKTIFENIIKYPELVLKKYIETIELINSLDEVEYNKLKSVVENYLISCKIDIQKVKNRLE